MEKSSRTVNTFKNMFISLILYGISYVAVFVARTFFVRILGNDYLSISGLFTNVITLVSFSELGLGAASVFCLYKPIAEKDYSKINALLRFFGNLYKIVAGITILLGIILLPFLPLMVDMEDLSFSQVYLRLVYILFIINTAVSYILVQKKLFLTADQKNYIANIIQQIIHVIQLVLQTVFLVATHNYIGYLIIQIVCTFLTNFITSCYVDKKYPDIMRNNHSEEINPEQRKEISQNITSIFFYKIGAVILNGTDNIIISAFIKTLLVGLCSNYTLVINAVNSVAMQCFNGIGASIGNHTLKASKKDQELVFRELDLFCVIVFTFCSVCLSVLLNVLIPVWLGENYKLDQGTVFALVFAFYITGVNQIPSLYRTSLGLFKDARFYPLFAAASNIILSIALAKLIGVSGVFWATAIVRFVFFTLIDSRLTYKKGFEMSPTLYYLKYCLRIAVFLIIYFIASVAVAYNKIPGITGLLISVIICVTITTICLVIAYGWKKESKLLITRVKTLIKHKKG